MSNAPHPITREVLARLEACPDPRLRQVMTSLVRHLHDFVRDVAPGEDEWRAAVDFLTATGQRCDDRRQEFILLSDTLGVTMLVDALAHPKPPGATESTIFGPFYAGEQPTSPLGAAIARGEPGAALVRVAGRVRTVDGAPVAGATVEVWQAAPNGLYDTQDPAQPRGNLRGTFRPGDDGAYAFRTLLPAPYPIPDDGPVGQLLRATGRHPFRPAHIHFLAHAPGYERLVTHAFLAGSEYLDSDTVFGVKPSLVVAPAPDPETGEPTLAFDLVLSPRRAPTG
ncbi:MAG TPA: dioxygenase [Polyangiaceae bacterium]|nr:dioxygenase [Polyangiaceae bacterium]